MGSFQTPITIKAAVNAVRSQAYLLPAFQREFVWKQKQIELLFDSIMKGYPISSMLFWKVKGETKAEFKFYKFLDRYIEGFGTHNEAYSTQGVNDFHAILDGQQRLTALTIGLTGTYAIRKKYAAKFNSESNYPPKTLYLNLSVTNDAQESERTYNFFFKSETEHQNQIIYIENNTQNKWFKVGEILNLINNSGFRRFGKSNDLTDNEEDILEQLYGRISGSGSTGAINFYEEEDQDHDKAVDIFVRINSGGTTLSFSDILMSIATATWTKFSAREQINNLVDNINSKGFSINKDYILKSILYLFHRDIKFKITSFKNEFMLDIETKWPEIENCIVEAFELFRSFGLDYRTLTSNNATLPVLYYLYHSGKYTDFSTKIMYDSDRKIIKIWLLSALLKRAFGKSADSVLANARTGLTTEVGSLSETSHFPYVKINTQVGGMQPLSSLDIESLIKLEYGNAYTFCVLALLYPNLDYKNGNFHQDHIHPLSSFRVLPQESRDKIKFSQFNSIINLQLIDQNQNTSKSDKSLTDWIGGNSSFDADFISRQLIPIGVSYSFEERDEFFEKRKEMLVEKLKFLLGYSEVSDSIIEDAEEEDEE